MTKMIGMTTGGTDPQLFHFVYWVIIAIVFLIGFKLFREG